MSSYLSTWDGLLRHAEGGGILRFVTGWSGRTPRREYCGWHMHQTIEVVYHSMGAGVTRVEHGAPISFAEDGVVVYAPDEMHDQELPAGGEDLCLHLEFPARVRRPCGAIGVGRIENPVVRAEMESLATLAQPVRASEQSILNCRVTAVLLTLLGQALRPEPKEAAGELRVRRAEEYIRQNYATVASLREVAEYAGVGPDHLRHLFQERRRSTLVRHLNEVRVARASSLLAVSDLPAKEIARQCGFRDVYYFSAVFNQLKGIAPGRFRNQKQLGRRATRPRRKAAV